MKNLKSLLPAILIVAAIVMLSAGCSKNKSDFVDSTAKAKIQLRDIDPVDQKFGAVKGFVFPEEAAPVVIIYDGSGSFNSKAATDRTGLFVINNVPPGVYTLEAIPTNSGPASGVFDIKYQSVTVPNVVVTAGNTTTLKPITLPPQ